MEMENANLAENSLAAFTAKFLAGFLISKLPWKVLEERLSHDIGSETQDQFVKATFLHPLCERFPVSKQYLRNFLKTLIAKVEDHGQEVSDTVLTTYSELISSSTDRSEDGYRIYFTGDEEPIGIRENSSFISNGTTGLCTWQAAFYLAEYCLQNKLVLENKRIFELGSGQGFVGISCIKSCRPASFCLSDHHPEVLRNLTQNVEANLETSRSSNEESNTWYSSEWKGTQVEVRYCDWLESDYLNTMDVDVVLASDVVYDKDLIPPLVNGLTKLLRPCSGSMAIIASTVRNGATVDLFHQELEKQGLTFEELDEMPQILCYERQLPVKLLRIQKLGRELPRE